MHAGESKQWVHPMEDVTGGNDPGRIGGAANGHQEGGAGAKRTLFDRSGRWKEGWKGWKWEWE